MKPGTGKNIDPKNEEGKAKDFEIAENPNPRANENIRIRTEEPLQNNNPPASIGSEITDGEAG